MYPHYFSLRCYCCRPLSVSNETAQHEDRENGPRKRKYLLIFFYNLIFFIRLILHLLLHFSVFVDRFRFFRIRGIFGRNEGSLS